MVQGKAVNKQSQGMIVSGLTDRDVGCSTTTLLFLWHHIKRLCQKVGDFVTSEGIFCGHFVSTIIQTLHKFEAL